MRNKTKHSQLPWGWWSECCRDGGTITTNQEGLHVAAPTYYNTNPELTKANAEFIVRACNSHYELIEALEELTMRYSGQLDNEGCRKFTNL